VWATWCPTCHYEHPFLLELAARNEVAIYGLDYKDNAAKAAEWLAKLGDPYTAVLFDKEGKLGLDLGVTGAPETYLVDAEGIVRLRYQGALDEKVWQQKFVPLLNEMQAASSK
jgi:cytochrome c biogenesis protein CcmG/thiol:disulfide interchange protein DsbE